MNILQAKQEIKNAIKAYLMTDENGEEYRNMEKSQNIQGIGLYLYLVTE